MASSDKLQPGIYTIPSGADFARDLAAGIYESFAKSEDPSALVKVTVLVPTRRAVAALQEAFERIAPGTALMMPVIRPIGDVDEEALVFEGGIAGPHPPFESGELPPAISGLKRQIMLAKLIRAWSSKLEDSAAPHTMSEAQALAYAGDLGAFLDAVDREEVSLDKLEDLVPENLAVHWQRVLTFLKILTESWPQILQEEAAMNPAARRSALIRGLAEAWGEAAPSGPVFIAGSTGSIPATGALMKRVMDLPQGFVVLPGLDPSLDENAWGQLGESHPQFGLKQLLGTLVTGREEVALWPWSGQDQALETRQRFLSEAMRPAETTELWQNSHLKQRSDDEIARAFEGFRLVVARDPAEEARTLALIMRETLEEPNKTVALVTPDREIARRVAAELGRWQIVVNDSAGTPLAHTLHGSLSEAIWQTLDMAFSPTALMALLKHPLVALGRSRPRLRAEAAALELLCLRGPRPAPGLQALCDLVEIQKEGTRKTQSRKLVSDLNLIFTPLLQALAAEPLNWQQVMTAFVGVAEALAATDETPGASRLWLGDAGEAMHAFMLELLEEGQAIEGASVGDLPAIFRELLRGRVVRPRYGQHPRCFIWGPLEARLQTADVILLAGLNEKTWPQEVRPDPWLSRPMATALGLPTPERRIGQSAHDFMQLACSREVFLTRSESEGGAPTVASRWIMRLINMCEGLGWKDLLSGADHFVAWARQLDQPKDYLPCKEPLPTPPLHARPRRASVTQVERWIRDPYGFYANHILQLTPLDPMETDGDARDRGTIIHTVLERFLRAYGTDLPDDAAERLKKMGEEVFDEAQASPEIRLFWEPRFKAIADWFVERERARQNVKDHVLEAKGELTFDAPGGPFTLTARADRIDLLGGGGIGIYDYKTGQLPTVKQVSSGLAPQLTLEAWIALAGGFKDLSADTLEELAFIGLTGGNPAGKVQLIEKDRDQAIEEAEAGLKARVALFDNEATPYPSRVHVIYESRGEPFDHLARVKEWSVIGDGE
ncbi:MAG: double-strand break repair protein AddB [Alphaproteobacteria bacterium]|nr:MAG: double-strand break repair protein AddB [Alphaproteobacteria bacterium]